MLLTHDAFLSDIIENPDDDAPRLIYADWLDDQDDPERAEFIRLQCRLARLQGDDPEQRILAARQTDLLALHEAAWRSSLPHLEGVAWEGDFKRGFIEDVCADSVAEYLREAPAIFTAAPVRSVHLGRLDAAATRELVNSPYLARLTELNLGNNIGLCRESVRILAQSPHVANLTALLLHYNALGDEMVSTLAGSPYLGELRELYLSGVEMGDAGAAALAGQGRLPHLTDLDLRDNQIGDEGAWELAVNLRLQQLETLWLVNNRIGEGGGEALAWTSRLPQLRRLYLNYNPIGNAGARAFADSPHHRRLIDLDLRNCAIRDEGGRALAHSPYLDDLQALWLGGNRLRMETLTLLRGASASGCGFERVFGIPSDSDVELSWSSFHNNGGT